MRFHIVLPMTGVLVAACSSVLDVARKAETTDTQWLWQEPTPASNVTPAYDSVRHHVYVLSADRELLALESQSGKVVWRKKYGSGYPIGSNIAVVGDLVILGDVDVWALRATTGDIVWAYGRVGGNEGMRTIAHDASTIFVSAFDGRVQRLSQTSSTLWSTQLQRSDSTLNSFGNTLIGPTLYVCGDNFDTPVQNGTLFALDAETGRERWRYEYTPTLPGQSSKCFSRVANSGDLIFSSQDDGRIFAHDAATGAVRWVIPRLHSPPGDPNGPGNGPYDDRRLLAADAEHLVSTSDDGTVICYSTHDGRELWRSHGLGAALDPAVLVAGKALITHIGMAAAYDLATGQLLWTRPSTDPHSLDPTRYITQPVLYGDTLILAGNAGTRARLFSRN